MYIIVLVINDKKCTLIINKTGLSKTTLYFQKPSENDVFIRGSGIDSAKKPLKLNGIYMFEQCLWVKGKYIVEELKNTKFI